MPDFAGSKIQKPRCRQRQRGSKTKKGTNTTANPSYVLRKFFFPPLLYIVYQIFHWAQIFVGFFRSRGRLCTAGGFSRAEFLQKNKPCKACTAKGRSVEKPLLPQIKYSTKYAKLQDVNYIYSIPYFPQNTTAKSQNLPAMHRQPRCSSADKKEQKLRFTGAVSKCLQHTRIHISGISPEIVFQNSLNVSNIMQAKLQVIHQLFYISRLIERKHNILTKNSRLIKTRRPRL